MKRIRHALILLLLATTITSLLVACGLFSKDLEQYTVTFDTMGGDELAALIVSEGNILTPPSAYREGHTLEGWYTSLNDGLTLDERWSFVNHVIKGDITLYAKWQVNHYTIYFDSDGGAEVAPLNIEYGTLIPALETPSKDNYTFVTWQPEVPDLMPADNLYLTAVWTESSSIDYDAIATYQTFLSDNNPLVYLEVAGMGTMTIELFPEVAQNTVNNFIELVQGGYYDGVEFHRIIENFMIQGGAGAPLTCRIAGEFASNGFPNALNHTRGVLSMARTMDPNSATSQFFIMHKNSPHLDGQYAAFGALRAGFDILDWIAKQETGAQDRPVSRIIINQATVDTKNYVPSLPSCYVG
ncbi:MAG: hypothetical protein EA374_02120 [Acholeplasmatales bacterium]|nr:MAG: hypothetical protein EA374_02120 [Acholeplasmatales bacterium]